MIGSLETILMNAFSPLLMIRLLQTNIDDDFYIKKSRCPF
jgi:hypothetical protein